MHATKSFLFIIIIERKAAFKLSPPHTIFIPLGMRELYLREFEMPKQVIFLRQFICAFLAKHKNVSETIPINSIHASQTAIDFAITISITFDTGHGDCYVQQTIFQIN